MFVIENEFKLMSHAQKLQQIDDERIGFNLHS